jgi:hypothetical protein
MKNQKIAIKFLKRAVQQLKMDKPILWVYIGTILPVIDELNPSVVVSHVVDDWTAFPGIPGSYADIEAQLLSRSDLTIVSSNHLFETRRKYARNIHLIRHGADLRLFRRALEPELDLPAELNTIPKPRIGYYGALHKIDMLLVEQCARQLPECSFVFVGPINGQQGIGYRATRATQELPNVFFLGARPQGQLPAYLKSFDVAWLPFKVNELTRSMCPIKMYEYLAAGKSVVSVYLPEIHEMAHVIRIAQDPRQIPSHLYEAVNEDCSSAVVAKRVKSVQHFSWEKRFMLFEELLAGVVH